MTADLSALIARLEAAEVGSREMDAHIEVAARAFEAAKTGLAREHWAVWRASSSGIVGDGATQYASAPVTTSLDAALALAERMRMNGPCYLYRCGVKEWGFHFEDCDTAYAKTPALALVIAILRAKQGEGE